MSLTGLDAQAAKIVDPSTDINVKLGIVRDIGRALTLEGSRDPEFVRTTSTVFPILIDTIKTGSPVFKRLVNDKENAEQVLRVQTLEVLHKFTNAEVIRPHLASLVPLLFDLIRNDNEDMGSLALKMFNELIRAARPAVDVHLPKFLALSLEHYSLGKELIDDLFGPKGAAMTEPDRTSFNKSFPSLRLIQEATILVAFIYQMAPAPLIAQLPSPPTLMEAAVNFYLLETPQEAEKDPDQMDEGIQQYGPPPSIVNKTIFSDFINTQAKVGSLLGILLRQHNQAITAAETWPRLSASVPPAAIRLMRVMPQDAFALRREGISAIRQFAATDMKTSLADLVPALTDERLIIGTLKAEPGLFTLVHTALADIIGHTRAYMSIPSLFPILKRAATLVSDTSNPQAMVTVSGKIIIGTLEILLGKLRSTEQNPSPDVTPKILTILPALLETVCTRLQASVTFGHRLMTLKDSNASEELKQLVSLEQSRTVPMFSYLAGENVEASLQEEKSFIRIALIAVKFCLQIIRMLGGRVPDANVLGRVFKSCCQSAALFKGDPSEATFYKGMVEIFMETEPHVFQEVWSTNMPMFFELMVTSPGILNIVELLYRQPSTTYSLTALILRHLVDNLEPLLENNAQAVGVVIRLLKQTFSSVASLPDGTERVIFPYLPRLLVDIFPMAARSQDPRNLLSVPFYLFRALGARAQSAKFDSLHREVFPLLPELLDGVNRSLELTDEPVQKEQLVEIALTAPARLQHFAPYITHLWRPLVLALGCKSPDLLRQGLRTLELTVDNISNVDLLDPTNEPVARELVLSLHKVLKPGHANADTAQAASRILGKIGGKNRRIMALPPTLPYNPSTAPVVIPVEFTSHVAFLQVGPACEVAVKVLEDPRSNIHHEAAFSLLRTQIFYLLQTGIDDRASDDLFVRVLEGLVGSIHLSNMEPAANELIREIAKSLFEMELMKDNNTHSGRRLAISPVTSQFLDTISLVLVQRHGGHHGNARRLIANIIQDLHDRGQGDNKERLRNTSHLLGAIIGKLVSLCWHADWRHKVAGCAGFSVLISDEVNLGTSWPYTKEIEFCRSLIMVLKDMPADPPAEVPEITSTILKLMRFCNPPRTNDQMQTDPGPLDEEARKEMTQEEIQHYEWANKPVAKKTDVYLSIFSGDLTSPNKTVRDAIQAILGLISELAGLPLSDFLKPIIDKLTTNIFLKPLRMFTPIVQIGFMDAMTYLLNIDPPVLEASDQLWRLLNEVIVLGEAEDQQGAYPKLSRRAAMLTAKTKAASIRLVTASLVVTDYFSKQANMRQRATTLLFKALYSPNPEIKDAAHEGLKVFLRNQSRLPREHLQAGLRPVLMNLADAAKLTVASLDGLARLLSLLTNYFKVEIATKLIDHFKALASDEVLRDAAYGPMADNDTISKLVRLLNIFHLLPSTANTYLEDVLTLVVTTETKIHATSPTLFTPPISAFLDRFPKDSVNILFTHLKEIRWVQTFRHVIQGGSAPNLVSEIKSQGPQLAQAMEKAENGHAGVPCILLCLDLAEADPEWMASQDGILEALKDVWVVMFTGVEDESRFTSARLILIRAIFAIWIQVLKVKPRVDVLFSLCLIFTRPVEINYSDVVDFISMHMANNTSVSFKHEAVQYFVTNLDEDSASDYQLLQYLRMVVLPLLTAEFRQSESVEDVVKDGVMVKVGGKVWSHGPSIDWSPEFATELLQLTGILVTNAFSKIGTDIPRGTVAKYIWDLLKAPDAMVRNTASLTAARFFSNREVASDKFQGSLWSALLKAPQDGETSAVARQALDIMTPVMTRLPAAEMTLKWDALICRTLSEEQNNISTIVHIYRLVLRHADQCYQSRDVFIPQFVQGLSKLGFNAGHTPETRTLALDLIDLIFEWQRRSSEEQKNSMAIDSTTGTPRWVMPTQLKDNIANFLIRLSLNNADTFTKPTLNLRYLLQLKTLFSSEDWSEVSIRLSFFSRAFEMPENAESSTTSSLIGYSKVLNVISSGKPSSWFLANASELFTFSKRAMIAPQDVVVDCFAPIFDHLLEVIPLGDENTELTGLPADIHQWLSETVREALSSGTRTPAALSILMSLAKTAPSRVEPFAGGLMKLYSKFIKDHLTPQPGTTPDQMAVIVQRIFSILDISRLSVAFFGDHRKQFLTGLVNLVTTSPSQDMRRRLLSLTREWVLESPTTIPTAKEKASLIGKMQGWLRHADTIYRDYLNLVYDVYTAPSLVRSDLTVRLETSFVLGCRVDDQELRTRFLDLFSNHIPKAIGSRLAFLLGGQSWESMADFNWAFVLLDMMFGAIHGEGVISPAETALSTLTSMEIRVQDIVQPMRTLLFFDPQAMHQTFVALFPEVWKGLSRKEQADITASTVHVLTKDMQYAVTRPNVFQSLLGGIQRCTPAMTIPPHVIKYLVKIYHAWYEGLEILQEAVEQGREDDATIREANQDALAEIYAELSEDDYYYGLWRRRCLYEETNAGLSYEQNGFYHFAQPLYEAGQLRTRQNIYPMSETEYYVWEDHWMLCAEKLLQWDILQDVASGEGNADLALECAWRTLQTWNSENVIVQTYMNQMQDPITPRRQLFKAYFTLNSMATAAREAMQAPQIAIDPSSEFAKIVDEANQLSLRKWATLPEHLTMAHVPILAQFQQVVELKEASLLMTILLATTRDNLNEKAHEAKSILHHWRERLPQPHDDIGIWNDLISWRQHVFHAVNKFYLPLLPDQPSQSTANTHAHRGHHESAWIINRFAHVARKHGLLQVCQSSLSDIYKLPNIEISEAFLKLREQARCHFEKPNEIYQGLEVINNTNLMYFTAPQKAEFFAMKGLFLHQLGRNEDSNAAFAQAVQLDFSMPKAWHLWGVYSDDMHTANPTDFNLAANAVSCYLQAASLYKSAKCRPLLNRVLWLLSMDDPTQTVGHMWDTYKGEHVYWYWITLVPQLLTSLSQREGRYAHQVLFNIAKNFPQALFYHLRSIRDEFSSLKREHTQRLQASTQSIAQTTSQPAASSTPSGQTDGTPAPTDVTASQAVEIEGSQSQDVVMAPPAQETVKQPWDMAEDLINLLKTGHPLLALTLEQLAETIRERLKPANDEEIYRVTGGLLSEALHNCSAPARDINTVSAQLHLNAQKLGATLPPGKLKEEFEAQLLKRLPSMLEFIQFIIYLRDQYETILDRKPRITSVDVNSHYLAEFHIIKFEKIHVLGQFQEHKDPTSHFVEVKRVASRLERCRTPLLAFKRFSFVGHDGSIHHFVVQYHPPTRNVRRDERFMQLTRIFNETLQRKKEARKRNLEFHLLTSVSLNPNLRLLKIDSSYVSMIDIYDEHCKERGFGREEPLLVFQEKLRTYYHSKNEANKEGNEVPKMEYWQLRLDAKNEIEAKYIPKTVISNYMKRTMKDSWALWTMRKQFTLQMATNSWLIWCMYLHTRPSRFLISRETGLIGLCEASIALHPSRPSLVSNEQTPFRLTPNIQDFITPLGIEGIFTSSTLALSRGLLEPQPDEIEKQMHLFIRDDFMAWFKAQGRHPSPDSLLEFRMSVAQAIEKIVARMVAMTGETERKKAMAAEGTSQGIPTTTVIVGVQQLINASTNPVHLAKNYDLSYPWY